MDNNFSIVNMLLGGINLVFILKLLFSDIKDLRDKIDEHLTWHLDSPRYFTKRDPTNGGKLGG